MLKLALLTILYNHVQRIVASLLCSILSTHHHTLSQLVSKLVSSCFYWHACQVEEHFGQLFVERGQDGLREMVSTLPTVDAARHPPRDTKSMHARCLQKWK
jgi:hypothetical protein